MKVNLFNQYFVNIGRDIAENLPNIPKKQTYNIFIESQHLPATLRFWNLKKFSKVLWRSKVTKQQALMVYHVISLTGPAIINGLENIFDCSFVTRTVPISWKRAKVTPTFKKGARTDIANYRPISLLYIPNKLFEHQVCNTVDEHLNTSSLKSSSQWGFTNNYHQKACYFQWQIPPRWIWIKVWLWVQYLLTLRSPLIASHTTPCH